MNVYGSLYLVDIFYVPVVKKLQLKTNSDRGKVFQSWILGRPERNEMDLFYLRVIQENIYDFQSKQKDEEENYKRMLITHNENLTDNKDQRDERVARIEPIENWLALSFQDKLYIFKSEDKTDEFIQADKILNSCAPFSLLQRISSSAEMNFSHIYESNYMHPLIVTQNQEAQREGLYKCVEDGKIFLQRSNLSRHQVIHTEEKLHKCDVCEKVFSQNSHLANHQRIHTGEKLHRCNECGKLFGQKTDLTNHLKIHTREKPYKCNECGQVFSQKATLTRHQRIHSGKNPYRCNECGRVFREKAILVFHQRNHTEEKPYKCNECGRSLHYSTKFRRHQLFHTEGKLYK
ncbi:zinc finger protein 665 [Bos taurus]|uniref:zinc finger protein 665 n=1 Tax=Bos taurus TaxID=9913 RepID=UPI000760383E|nr:zinc finger protein 665 [Bos taurus]